MLCCVVSLGVGAHLRQWHAQGEEDAAAALRRRRGLREIAALVVFTPSQRRLPSFWRDFLSAKHAAATSSRRGGVVYRGKISWAYSWPKRRLAGLAQPYGAESGVGPKCLQIRRVCLDLLGAFVVDLVLADFVGLCKRLLHVTDPALLEQGDDARMPGGSTSSTSALISFFCRRSMIAPVPAPIPAPTAADVRDAGGKTRPMIAPPTAPSTAPLPTSLALSFTSIFPSAPRLTSTRPSAAITSGAGVITPSG
jgi:hypothetical protein